MTVSTDDLEFADDIKNRATKLLAQEADWIRLVFAAADAADTEERDDHGRWTSGGEKAGQEEWKEKGEAAWKKEEDKFGGLPFAENSDEDKKWEKAYLGWSNFGDCEATRASADRLAGLDHRENPDWPFPPDKTSDTRARFMLGRLAASETGQRQVDNMSPDSSGRWSGQKGSWDREKLGYGEHVRIKGDPLVPIRRMTIPDSRWVDFRNSTSEGKTINFSLASFAVMKTKAGAESNARDFGWGGDEPHEVFLSVQGHPRVLNTQDEVVTGGRFQVVSSAVGSDGALRVVLRQTGVYGPDGNLVQDEDVDE
jgi:hypothetical protein